MTRWFKKAKVRVNGKVREFTRRRVRVDRSCSRCKRGLAAGSLFWQRGHMGVHIWCFEEMQRGANQRTRHAGGRPRALNTEKMAAIVAEHRAARDAGREFNIKSVAHELAVSPDTVRRFIKGEYRFTSGQGCPRSDNSVPHSGVSAKAYWPP